MLPPSENFSMNRMQQHIEFKSRLALVEPKKNTHFDYTGTTFLRFTDIIERFLNASIVAEKYGFEILISTEADQLLNVFFAKNLGLLFCQTVLEATILVLVNGRCEIFGRKDALLQIV